MKETGNPGFSQESLLCAPAQVAEIPLTSPSGWRARCLSALGSGGFRWLAEHPVLWRGARVTFVTFGLFAAIEAVIFQMVIWAYFHHQELPLERMDLLKMLSGALAVCLGAKLFHWVAIWRTLVRDPRKHLAETGFYLQGGILGAILWALVAFRHGGGAPVLVWMDALSCAGLLGQVAGRLGCLSYGCCFGKPCSCGHGIVYRSADAKIVRWRPDLRGIPLHPTPLYDGLASLLGFFTALFLLRGNPDPGIIAAFSLGWHGATRLVVERYRADIHSQGGRNWITGITAFILGVAGIALGTFIQWRGPEFEPIHIAAGHGASLLETSAVFAMNALLVFAVYGIHGRQLGRFPFSAIGGSNSEMVPSSKPAAG